MPPPASAYSGDRGEDGLSPWWGGAGAGGGRRGLKFADWEGAFVAPRPPWEL